MLMPGRSYSSGSLYRYGFNGKENDNEVKGTGNQQDYGMRVYDPRLGKFLSIDPLTKAYPELTPYQFASNTPIQAIDLDGLEKYVVTYRYGSSGDVISVKIASIRAKDSKAIADLNFHRANGGDITKANVYIRHLNQNGTQKKQSEERNNLTTEETSLYNRKGRAVKDKWEERYYEFNDQQGRDRGAQSEIFDGGRYEFFEANRFNFKSNEGYYAYLGTTSMLPGNTKNGTLSTEMMPPELKNAPSDMRNAGYKKIMIEINGNIDNVTDEQFNAYKAGLENVGSEYKKMFSKSGVSNIEVKVNVTRNAKAKSDKPAVSITAE